MEYTVGELAKRAGLTVRALHHYEKLGLLLPSGRTQAGYRLYNEPDVVRLHRLLAYRYMGLALKDIKPLLGGAPVSLADMLAQQIASVQAQIGRQQRLLEALQGVATRAAAGADDVTDHLLIAMGKMRLFEKYFSAEDMLQFDQQRAELGGKALREIEAEWPQLIAAVTQEMERGTDPRSDGVQALMKRWIALVESFVQGNEAIRGKIRAMYANEPQLREEIGLSPALIAYLRQATDKPDAA